MTGYGRREPSSISTYYLKISPEENGKITKILGQEGQHTKRY
jgi:hypothetical protein